MTTIDFNLDWKLKFTLFIFFFSFLSLLGPCQPAPDGPLTPAVWETAQVLLGNTPSYYGDHHK